MTKHFLEKGERIASADKNSVLKDLLIQAGDKTVPALEVRIIDGVKHVYLNNAIIANLE
ncbi:hypothetical protein ACKC5Q_13025 [Aeromonas dhakensis]|uniref:hypothetical protein n=1 Tax=Aeromonas dhakensis TaxID=196024 RepID=UPI0038B521F1